MRDYYSVQAGYNLLYGPLTQGLLIVGSSVSSEFIEGSSTPFRSWADKLVRYGFAGSTTTIKKPWPLTSRFADHLSAISTAMAGFPSSPVYHHINRKLFPFCLGCPLSNCKDDLYLKDLRRELKILRNRQAFGRTTAWVGA